MSIMGASLLSTSKIEVPCAVPAAFSAVHMYIPLSDSTAFLTLRVFPDISVLGEEARFSGKLLQVTFGGGLPDAIHRISVFFPSEIVCVSGSILMDGGLPLVPCTTSLPWALWESPVGLLTVHT